MNKEKIAYYIKNPKSINDIDIEEVKTLKTDFPYCSTFHLMYLAALSDKNSLKFEQELKFSSIHINDRERLKEIIELEAESSSKDKRTVQIASKENIEERQIFIEKEPIIVVDTENIPPKKTTDLELPEEVKSIHNTKEEDKELLETKKDNFDQTNLKKDNIEIDILAQAMEVAFELDVDNIIREKSVDKELTSKGLIVEEKIEKALEIVDEKNLSFTDWLKLKQGKVEVESRQIIETKKVKLTKEEVNNLLDKFIQEEPKMTRPKKEFFNPIKNAKDSLESETILVSETLAKIYWMQKNFDKAIKAYTELSLLYPEKSIIFANQITEIEKELNKK